MNRIRTFAAAALAAAALGYPGVAHATPSPTLCPEYNPRCVCFNAWAEDGNLIDFAICVLKLGIDSPVADS